MRLGHGSLLRCVERTRTVTPQPAAVKRRMWGEHAGVEPKIVAIDSAFVVVDKPAGLLAVPGRSEPDCAAVRVRAMVPDALVVHRLDMATSGLLVFARGAAAQRALSMAFERRAVDKRYQAVVAGIVEADEGSIDAPLAADWPNRPRQAVDAERGKPSLTRWRVLARDWAGNHAMKRAG